MKGEGGGLKCMHRDGTAPCYIDAIAAWRPLCFYSCTYHVQFFSNRYSSLHICANAVWKRKFNGYCNECWLNRSEKQEEGNARDPERRRGLFRCSGVVGFHEEEWFGGNMIIFSLCFSSYTGESSATRRQGAPSTRIIRRFFTSDKQAIWLSLGLFEENMFLRHTPGSPTSGKK